MLKRSILIIISCFLIACSNTDNQTKYIDRKAPREKEDRRGNVKFDLNVGLDNTRVGVTANVGYDTKGENLRGGVGLRVIF